MIAPLLTLPYQSALTAFDAAQFLLLPLMALLLYRLLVSRGKTTVLLVTLGVILLPLPFDAPQWGISASYYWQWAEGQSKVLETFLLLLSFYLGSARRPHLSGVVYAFGAFDPRVSILALPLFLVYNDRRRTAVGYAVAALAAFNFPLLYPPMATGFLSMVLSSGLSTPPYYYTFIPLFTVICLTAVEWGDVSELVGEILHRVGL